MPIVGHQKDTDQGHHRIGLPRIVDGSPNLLKAHLFAEITAQKNEQRHVEEIDNGISSQHHAMRISIRLRKMTDRNEHDQEEFQSVKHFVSLCRHFVNWQVNNNFQSPSNLLLIYNTEHRKEEAPDLRPCKSTQIFLLPEGKKGGNSAAKKEPGKQRRFNSLVCRTRIVCRTPIVPYQKISIFRPKARERMSVSVTRLLGTADTT